MRRVRLIHWNAAEAKPSAARLREAGYQVDFELTSGPDLLRALKDDPPMAVVIDLGRLPAQGRDVALALRLHRATRRVPLVFVGGDGEKVAGIRKTVPDAVYTPWSRIRSSLAQAIACPPADPVVPRSALEGYSGRPLVKKLGVKADWVVGLVGAPRGFRGCLGELPAGAQLRAPARGRCDLLVWFVRSRKDLRRGIGRMAAGLEQESLWIAWPKKTSRLAADLSQQHVRQIGLAAGLVDYKICAIDATWSALLFTRRNAKAPRPRPPRPRPPATPRYP